MYEFIATFFLVFIIFGTAVHQKLHHTTVGFCVGAYVIAAILAIGKWTGGCMNPARVIGPAFLNGDLFDDGFWVYYTAPIAGGITAGLFYDFVMMKAEDELTPEDYILQQPDHKIEKGYAGKTVEKRQVELTVWDDDKNQE